MNEHLMTGGRNILEKAKNVICRIEKRRFTPYDMKSDDIFIVEFPKSGITWLSTIIGNIALNESQRPERITFANVQLYIPDVHMSRAMAQTKFDRPPMRIIKSHSSFNPHYNAVIYLARHPVAVMKSYHKFLQVHKRDYDLSFGELCKSKKFGVSAWKEHVNSWLRPKNDSFRMHLIKYENLVSSGFQELSSLSQNFGWNFSEESIKRGLAESELSSMRSLEALYRKYAPHYDFSFVGGARVTEKEIGSMERWISLECENELALLGYEDSL